jgi:hypothetical protein
VALLFGVGLLSKPLVDAFLQIRLYTEEQTLNSTS